LFPFTLYFSRAPPLIITAHQHLIVDFLHSDG
jgi:hypothetical protein